MCLPDLEEFHVSLALLPLLADRRSDVFSRIVACATQALGQDKAPEPVATKITTVDGVKLNATFYPSPKKNSPVVIMVHPIGEGKNSKAAEWRSLAESLQAANYAVMTFDLRGHGESTSVDPELLWSEGRQHELPQPHVAGSQGQPEGER